MVHLAGKEARLVASGLISLLRNSPSTVISHCDSGLVCVQLPSGSQRTFLKEELYWPTGKETIPLPEEMPDCCKPSQTF